MVDLLSLEKSFIEAHIKKGGVAVDFTMGNGHDTEYLSKAVGEEGKVYAFDIQEQALINTGKLLEESACPKNYTLIHDSHANVKEYVNEKICAGMFNLGYLPGAGNKSVTTKRESTKKAVCAAIELLDDDGIILIAVYPGHEEGALEGEMLTEMLAEYDRKVYCVSKFRILNSPTSPFFILIEKR
ncbi:MAG: 16S rRNA (cytosine(1402)-N(4))-methyltransferase [Ruminococcaceae bacterium]|nr:16S rRNA (cytosine(1402)-N(4))-methyltransferase [Oscillospiraceae bacterium]